MSAINPDDYRTVAQTAARWGVSRQRVHVWISEDRVKTIQLFGTTAIHRNARKPSPKKTRQRKKKSSV